ncbi:YdeI/OmpD-associated family protein, partial [Streptomyces sp. NPDC093808]|uniref:YdeI/OmpD-associated family protein n=1 Tax=Streptomyces sp. NPDC093808 TaxID=3154985 RepID=UPI0034501AA8
MRPAGLREVEKARADGRWEAAYASQRTATVPDDLRAALAAAPAAAREFFEALDSRNRYAILHRIEEAKRARTRAARIVAGPDTVVVEMGIPQSAPRGALHIATHGAA